MAALPVTKIESRGDLHQAGCPPRHRTSPREPGPSTHAAAVAPGDAFDEGPAHGRGLRRANPRRMRPVSRIDASSYGWLGEHDRARKAAQEAIDCYRDIRGPLTAPTRLAIAQLDLVLAHSALGEPEAAVLVTREALGAGRLVQSVRGRAKQVNRQLRIDHFAHPDVMALNEEVRFLTA